MQKRYGGRECSPRHLFIVGESGVGKSKMVQKYTQKYPGYVHKDSDGTEYDIKPVVYLELPDPFTILEFYQSIISALGAPIVSSRSSIGDVKRQAFKLIEKQQVEMLIFDEMDYILTTRYVKHMEAMEAMKHIANNGNISMVCVGTPNAEVLQRLNFQYFRRYPITRFERFKECDDEFCEFLKRIEEEIGAPISIELSNKDKFIPQLLHFMSKGLVGILTPVIQEAYRLQGVFEVGFSDFNRLKLTVNSLKEAYQNIVGDITDEDFRTMLKDYE